jgi:hypothetical protein
LSFGRFDIGRQDDRENREADQGYTHGRLLAWWLRVVVKINTSARKCFHRVSTAREHDQRRSRDFASKAI